MEREGIPQPVEAAAALVGLVVASPVLAAVAAAIALGSPGPILFRQERVGRGGRPFVLTKFRTMVTGNVGIAVTAQGDPRITPIGRLLRATKLDELPELWNVVRGEMALVGPRPEVPRYVDLDDPLWQEVLRARPGLTDPITLELRDEEHVMAAVDGDREAFYLRVLQRYKLLGSAAYLRERTWWSDVRVLVGTVLAVLGPGRKPPPTVESITARVARAGEAPVEP